MTHNPSPTIVRRRRGCRPSVLVAALAGGAACLATGRAASAVPVTVFDNQFNTTWDIDANNDGTFESTVATYSPAAVSAKFRQTGQAQVWNVSLLQPQPWNNGTVIFAGGGNSAGEITTEVSTLTGLTYTFDWGTTLIGAAAVPAHVLTSSAYAGSGTGGAVLGSSTLSSNPAGATSFTFAGTGGTVTLATRLTTVGNNASTDVGVNFIRLTSDVPEPASLGLLAAAAPLLLARRSRRR